jgi:hypothetical protein
VCWDLTLDEDVPFGGIRQFCDKPLECLLDEFGLLKTEPSQKGETGGAATASHSAAELDIKRVMSFAHTTFGVMKRLTSVSATMVIEEQYFDLDYRSEFSRTLDSSFQLRDTEVRRLHFFSQRIEHPQHLRDFVEAAREAYLGYVIVHPQGPGLIGRSISPLR